MTNIIKGNYRKMWIKTKTKPLRDGVINQGRYLIRWDIGKQSVGIH